MAPRPWSGVVAIAAAVAAAADAKIPGSGNQTFQDLLHSFKRLAYRPPTEHNTLEAVARGDAERERRIAAFAGGTHIFLHARAFKLAQAFLTFKRARGTSVEKGLYRSMDVHELITRLLVKRPLVFMNRDDTYKLPSGEKGAGEENFLRIGTTEEQPPLVLSSYLSYDEMQVAALLGVAVPSFFINDGARNNKALPGEPGTFEDEGVVIDQVGCRFERPGLMEWKHMVVTEEQNTRAMGYGARGRRGHEHLLDLFADLYGVDHFPTFEEARALRRLPNGSDLWAETAQHQLLNVAVFRERYRLQAVAFLAECSAFGLEESGAYCHVSESVELEPWWTIDTRQALWLLQGFHAALRAESLPGVRVVDFPKFSAEYFAEVFGSARTVVGAAQNPIQIRSSSREPGARLQGSDAGLRVVYQFAGDGNAYPGNEYWLGALSSSADPAAASFSLIPWLQNPDINPQGLDGSKARVIEGAEGAPSGKTPAPTDAGDEPQPRRGLKFERRHVPVAAASICTLFGAGLAIGAATLSSFCPQGRRGAGAQGDDCC